MQIVKTLLGTNTTSATDVGTLRAKHADAASRIAEGWSELERLASNLEKLKMDRARLLAQRDSEEGLDLFEPIRAVEGALATAQRRHADLADIQLARGENVAALEAQVRAAERAAAPARMRALVAEHARDRQALRTAMEDIRSLAGKILAGEANMQGLFHQHGVTASGVLIVEALAVSAQATANDVLSKLTWQDQQVQQGDALADKLAADRAEVARRNDEAGYPLYHSPAASYFESGWLDETVEQRSQRAAG
jgi:hypothetical protein